MFQSYRMRRLARRRVLLAMMTSPLAAIVGCGDGDEESRTPTASTSATPPPPSTVSTPGAYFPPAGGEWETIAPDKAGFRSAGIQDVVKLVGESRSSTFMLLYGGRIVTENYFGTATAATATDVASVQKSVVSTMIGIARERGMLTLDDTISKYLGPGWSRGEPAHEAAITIRHLMTHSSGLDPRTMRSVVPPGTKFDYNTTAYQKLRPLLEKVAGQDITTITRAWIFDKIAAPQTTFWRLRPNTPPDPVGDSAWGLIMNAREMARFGLLAERRGQWAATSVVKPSWFDEAWAPSQVEKDYGLLWWLMTTRYERAPGIPSDWYAALGAGDQKIYVVPSLDLVVTRQGRAAAEESESYSSFDLALFRAIAAARA